MTAHADPPRGMTRRDALRRGALLGGATVWAIPTVQAVAMSAHAGQNPSAPPFPPPPTGPVHSGKVPSHAVFILRANGKLYGFKIDVSGGASSYFGKVASPSDNAFLAAQGYTYVSDPKDAGWAALLGQLAGHGAPGSDSKGEQAIVLTLPPGATFVDGYSFDGGLQKCTPTGSKYQRYVGGGPFLFYGTCH